MIWYRAMASWRANPVSTVVSRWHSVRGLTEDELAQFACQVYAKMRYRAERTGQTGDHGVDVRLVTPDQQVELVQCKQWSKPVGEREVRDLMGVMMHSKAVRGWLWAPRGFSRPAWDWAHGKPIKLMNDVRIDQLVETAYENGASDDRISSQGGTDYENTG